MLSLQARSAWRGVAGIAGCAVLMLLAGAASYGQGLSVVIDATNEGGTWWYPQAGPGFDPQQQHQGTKLAGHLRGRGWSVRELPRGMPDMSPELAGAQVAVCWDEITCHTAPEVGAYQDFVEGGGALLLLAGFRKELRYTPLAEAFGVRFEGSVRGATIQRWADHPITRGLTPMALPIASLVTRYPRATTPLGWLGAGTDAAGGTRLVMGLLPYGKGKVVFFSAELALIDVPQPFTDRLLDLLAATK